MRRVAAALIAFVLGVACTPAIDDATLDDAALGDVTVDVPTVDVVAGLDRLAASLEPTDGIGALARTTVLVRDASGEVRLRVAALVADTAAARSRGLQGVRAVPTGTGMLFVFPDEPGIGGRPGFWMLDTLTPLDIAFVAEGAVVGTATMRPCAARPCPITHPGVPYDAALEVAAGTLEAAGVAVGDAVAWGAG